MEDADRALWLRRHQGEASSSYRGRIFDTVYWALLRDVLLGIARLSDPLKTGGKDNLVLERLLQLPEVVADAALCGTVTRQFAEVKERAVPFREYPNKYPAHIDLLTSVQASEEADRVTTDDIESMLAAIAKLFNMVDGPLRDWYVFFDKVATVGGTGHLLVALEDAEGFAELPQRDRHRLRQLAAETRRLTRVAPDGRRCNHERPLVNAGRWADDLNL